MTTLILAQKKIFGSLGGVKGFFIVRWLEETDRRGILTRVLLGLIGFFAIVYIGAVFSVFKQGFDIKSYGQIAENEGAGVLKLELKVQELKRDLALNHQEILESMERISAIKYVTPEEVVASNRGVVIK